MEASFTYNDHPSSVATVIIRQSRNNNDIINPLAVQFQNLSINNHNINTHITNLPTLAINFHLRTHDTYWYRPSPYESLQFQGQQTHTKSRTFNVDPSEYMSYGMFYSFMLAHLVDGEWGEEFDRNYRCVVIHDMISTLREFVDPESNKGRQNLKVFVGVTVTVHHHLDERILFEESSNNRMVPASKSSMQLLKRIEVDGSIMMSEDCAICLEELGKEQRELLCMPCSHIFHGDCVTKWLENGHCCPICRYQMPTE